MRGLGAIEAKGWWQAEDSTSSGSSWPSRLRDARSRAALVEGMLEYLPARSAATRCNVVLWEGAGEPSNDSVGLCESFWPEWLHRWREHDAVVKAVLANETATHNLCVYSVKSWNKAPFLRHFLARLGIYYYMSAPLHGPGGTLTGLINLYRSAEERSFDEADLTSIAVSAAYLSAALARVAHEMSDAPIQLAPRETEVARLAAKGLNNTQISDRLGIARDTVKKTLGRVYEKLQVNGRAQMAAHLVRNGVLL
jgi:DNA-binding CsgD family transcriptional regulator